LVAADDDDARALMAWVLDYLPANHIEDAPRGECADPLDRLCAHAAGAIPESPTASYDVRGIVADVVDEDSVMELRSAYAPNLVTVLARLAGRPVGVVANQPQQRAGTLDIEASRKAARFVAWCDAFNLPIVTFVDTPGFEPGRDLEWRGMIRHGAELVHAYCAATVPRLGVIMRKAFGGAYIVMDSRGIGNDLCVAWPTAEIAVMGAAPATRILYKRDDPAKVAEYETLFLNPYVAAERGYVDAVIEPGQTRRVLTDTLEMLASKRDRQPARAHSNTPL
jgi:acetyl-CoA carboxylase carboxyltransferase component